MYLQLIWLFWYRGTTVYPNSFYPVTAWITNEENNCLPEQLLGHNSACNRLVIYLAQRCLRQHSVLFRTAFSRTASYWTVDSAHIDSTPSRTVLSFDNRCHEQCSAQSLFRTAGWLRVITYSAKIDSVFLDSTHAAWASIVADSADQKTIKKIIQENFRLKKTEWKYFKPSVLYMRIFLKI